MTTVTTFISESYLLPVAGIELGLDLDLDLDLYVDISINFDIDIPTPDHGAAPGSIGVFRSSGLRRPVQSNGRGPARQGGPDRDGSRDPQGGGAPQEGPAPTKPPPSKGYAHLFKYVVIGESGVGKTALIRRFCKDSFEESRDYTIGVDFVIKTMQLPNGDEVKLQVCR